MRDEVGALAAVRRRPAVVAVFCAALALAVAEFAWCVFHCDTDFLWHRHLGEAFLSGSLYDPIGQHYLPARALLDVSIALLPYRLDRAVWLIGTCAALVWCVRWWVSSAPVRPRDVRPAALAALAITGTYLHRDFAECGLQLFLLALLTVAVWALTRGRPRLCGAVLAAAIVYKLTPALFLPYLLLKRQWRAAAWTAGFAGLLCLLPALVLGWEQNLALHKQWGEFTLRTLTLDDPSENGVEPPTVRNQSLPLLLARQVQHYPAGHPLYHDSALASMWGGLSPPAAKRVVTCELLLLAAAIAWRCRRPTDPRGAPAELCSEWAAACVFVALLSPLCWLQHLVLVIPAALLFAARVAAGRAPRWQLVAAGLATALMLIVHRDLIGAAACDALSCCQPHTLACLITAGLALAAPRVASVEVAAEPVPAGSSAAAAVSEPADYRAAA